MMPAAAPTSALERLRRREPVFGVMQTLASTRVTEAALAAGFDFVMLDCEQGVVDDDVHVAALALIRGSTAFSAVRVKPGDLDAVDRYLARGADAILMPDVRDRSSAAAFATRANNGAPLLFAMIESSEGVRNAAVIAETPGIAGLVIGPHDLAENLGAPKDFTRPAFTRAVGAVEKAATEAGILLGGGAYAGFPLERLLAKGHSLILAGSDVAALNHGYQAQFEATLAKSKRPHS